MGNKRRQKATKRPKTVHVHDTNEIAGHFHQHRLPSTIIHSHVRLSLWPIRQDAGSYAAPIAQLAPGLMPDLADKRLSFDIDHAARDDSKLRASSAKAMLPSYIS